MDIKNKMNQNYILRAVSVSDVSEDKNFLRYLVDFQRGCLNHLIDSFIAYQDEKIVCSTKCGLETTVEKVKGLVSNGRVFLIKVGSLESIFLME